MKVRLLSTLLALFTLISVALAAVLVDGSFIATPDASKITLRWVSSDESRVASYAIARAAGVNSNAFVDLESVLARGNGSSYEYVDNTVFKTTDSFYRYRLTPLDRGGNQVGDAYYTGSSLGKVSGVRRTWGSIKAMFR